LFSPPHDRAKLKRLAPTLPSPASGEGKIQLNMLATFCAVVVALPVLAPPRRFAMPRKASE
jgi:hypothetical protein